MYRSIYPELILNNLYAPILKELEEIVEDTDDPKALTHYEEVKAHVIPERKLSRIENDFSEKANFLLSKGKITSDIATSLKELHRYRNEMYHRDYVRYDVLRAVTAVYFDIVCTLMERYDETTRHPYVVPLMSVSGSATEERFKPPARVLVEELRSGMEWDWPEIARELKDNLQCRIERTIATVMVLNLALGDVGEDMVLKLAQTYRDHPTSGPDELKDLAVPYDMRDLRQWARQAERLNAQGSHVRFFNRFAEIERSFEVVEECVSSLRQELERVHYWAMEEQREIERIERLNRASLRRDSDNG